MTQSTPTDRTVNKTILTDAIDPPGVDDAAPVSSGITTKEWFYYSGTDRIGPLTELDFIREIDEGKVREESKTWHSGASAWVPFSATALAQQRKGSSPGASEPPPLASLHRASPSWQTTFKIFESTVKEFAPPGSAARKASFFERQRLTSWWGFIFGPFYYMRLGMYQKAAILLSVSMLIIALLQLVEALIGISFPKRFEVFVYLLIPAYCAGYAVQDYYLLCVRGEKVWSSLKFLEKPRNTAIATAVVALLFVSSLVVFETPDDILNDASGVWREDESNVIWKLNLAGSRKTMTENNKSATCDLKRAETESQIVSLVCKNSAGSLSLVTIRKYLRDDGSFTLGISVNDEAEMSFSYVRPL